MKDEELQEIADMYGLYTEIDLENHTASLKKQIKELKQCVKTAYIKGMRHLANALKKYDRTEGAWTDYFEHTVDLVLKRELKNTEKSGE